PAEGIADRPARRARLRLAARAGRGAAVRGGVHLTGAEGGVRRGGYRHRRGEARPADQRLAGRLVVVRGGPGDPGRPGCAGVIERGPFRGNGFAPGETNDVIAEFKVDSARLPHGAQMWRMRRGSTETLVALLDADGPRWRPIGPDNEIAEPE